VIVVGAVVFALAGCSGSGVTPQSPGGEVQPTGDVIQPAPDPAAEAAAIVERLADADLVGQVLMPSINLSESPDAAAGLVRDYRLGGVVLMGNVEDTANGGSAAQVRALTDALRAAADEVEGTAGATDLLLATDQEYGWVTRIKSGMVQLPSAMAFGAAARPGLTEAAWRGAGAELAAVGVNVDFAPTADVLGPPGNFVIGSRSYGSDPVAASAQVAAAVRGLQASGVAATLKHFPGHGGTTVNSHVALPVLAQPRADLDARDLAPFREGIGAGSWIVMSGHLDVQSIDPGIPASFSSKVLIDLLRTEMGFTGVVVSDALNMEPARRWPTGEAAVRALLAGNDLLLMPPDLAAARDGLLAALANGSLPRSRLVEAATRVLTLRFRLAGFPRPDLSTVDAPANRDAARAVAAAAVTVFSGSCTGPLVDGPVAVTAASGRTQPAAWLADALRANGVTVGPGGRSIHLVGYGDSARDLSSSATVTVAMDTPYVLQSAKSPVKLATYSSTQVAMEALAAVIAGKAPAAGRSPVAVTGLPASVCAG
jgi:beta-N-acetylhexosaminidase